MKEGSYIIIDGEPCRIVEYDKSKPGKHGAAKARVVAIGVFDGVKRSIVSPVASNIEVPIIEKKTGQIISASTSSVQIMDLESFDVFESPVPTEGDLVGRLRSGVEVEYWQILGRKKVLRVKS